MLRLTVSSMEDILGDVLRARRQDLDLRRVTNIDPYALLFLALLIRQREEEDVPLTVRWPESNEVRRWMQAMRFFDDAGIRPRTASGSPTVKETAQPVTRIKDEAGIGRVVDRFEALLRAAYPLSEGSRRTLTAVMIELFQNIPHHSNATGDVADVHGIAAMADDHESLLLSIADKGIGFRRSLELREGLADLSDEAALYQVMVVGKSRYIDPGRGGELRRIENLARLWEGEFIVRSGTSMFVAHEEDERFYDVSWFPGVQIALRLPRTLFDARPVDFSDVSAFNGKDERTDV